MKPLGVILAGGGASRMGRDKAMVDVAGRPMVEWVADAVRPITNNLLVMGRAGTLAGIACVPDDHPARRGPLAGLATALRIADGAPVLLVAVDQPWVRSETLAALLDRAGPLHAVVPVDRGARQVTCGIYPGTWAERAAAEDEDNGSVQSLLDQMLLVPVEEDEWQSWGEDGRSWFSIDTDGALTRGLDRYGPPPG